MSNVMILDAWEQYMMDGWCFVVIKPGHCISFCDASLFDN